MEPARGPPAAEVRLTGAQEQAVRGALRPRGVSERVRARLTGGWTAAQVCERLPDRAAFDQEGSDVVDAVYGVLVAMARTGAVVRTRVRWTARLNTKGHRDMLVDVFRLA